MRIADLYIRVSTDEQADKGYSQRNQEELLQRYCTINNILIRKTIFEDHSAKTFERPQWKLYLQELKKLRTDNGLLLFLKWDRFSRNAGDAYQMMAVLRNHGVEPQAIEQPLDLSIPENKMMLAFYLAAPEVENDRRSLNILGGMRRARKEGRYMGLAPFGYVNKSDEYGRKYIAVDRYKADLIRKVFVQLEKGMFNTEQIYNEAKRNGLSCSKSNFWRIIRNPIYCGKISLPAYKGEAGSLVKGQHEAIISEELFESVQYVLEGRSRSSDNNKKITTSERIFLRGFVRCPKCSRLLTASSSKGRRKYYSYYHCTSGCPFRIKAEDLNEIFYQSIKTILFNANLIGPWLKLVKSSYIQKTANVRQARNSLFKLIKDANSKIINIRELLVKGKLETSDYQELRDSCERTIETARQQLGSIPPPAIELEDIDEKKNIAQLKFDKFMRSANVAVKRKVIALFLKNCIDIIEDGHISFQIKENMKIIFLNT